LTYTEFNHRFHIPLTSQQQAAIRTVDGPVLLLAVPGSGKTTTLVARLGYMLLIKGIPPENILTMTYTVAATADMRARFDRLFGPSLGERLQFRTINGVCSRIIRQYERLSGSTAFALLTEEKELSGLLTAVYRETVREFPTESDIKGVRSLITYAKNRMLSPEEIRAMDKESGIPFSDLYNAYNRQLKQQKLMDYDDQMVYALRILRRYPEILADLQKQYPYLCVDEAQDTSKIQHTIIALIAGAGGNLFMVGDEDQSIYGFRAAYPEALMEFEQNHPGAKILLMEENFRSNARIVDAAGKFIAKNRFRHPKTMRPTRPPAEEIREIALHTRRSQYSYLARLAPDLQEETAVLYRDNESALPLIDLLERAGQPCRIRAADPTFFSHRIIRDITGIIRFALDGFDAELFGQIYYKMGTFLSRDAAARACEISRREQIPILDAALTMTELSVGTMRSCRTIRTHLENLLREPADRAVYRIYHYMGYCEYLERMNIRTNKIAILEAIGANESSPEGLLRRLDELENLVRSPHQDEGKLILSTVHSAKGLEFDTVYLLDVFDGIFPEALPDPSTPDEEALRAYEEERRLFYVALTRAKNRLYLFTCAEEKSTFCREVLVPSAPKAPPKPAEKPVQQDNGFAVFSDRFTQGKELCHRTYGAGIITARSGDILTVRFADGQERRFSLLVLYEHKLIL